METTQRYLRAAGWPALLLAGTTLRALRTAQQFVRTVAWPALLLASRTWLQALRTAQQFVRTVAWPALPLAPRTAVRALRTAWGTRARWWPALLLAGGTAVRAARTTWRGRAEWWPLLLPAVRTWLREFRTAWLARASAAPVLLLILVVLVSTAWVARAADLIPSRPSAAAPASDQVAEAAPKAPAKSPAPASPPPATPAPATPPPATPAPATPAPAETPAPQPAPPCPVTAPPAPPPPPPGLTDEQIGNARVIAQVAHDRGLPERAVVIALATAMQESKLINLDYGDRDSLGLFQQRPSMGWGTPAQVRDPSYAAGKFYDGLVRVRGWDTARLTDAAQTVQRSGFPELYQKWEGLATALAASVIPVPPAQAACP